AEDGIRDGHVTGVQTCALPISLYVAPEAAASKLSVEWVDCSLTGMNDVECTEFLNRAGIRVLPGRYFFWNRDPSLPVARIRFARSEERRVGKECRCLLALYQCK